MQSDNEKMLQEIVQNTEMGKNTLDELISLTHDQRLKDEMMRQKREYRRINQAAHTALDAIGAEAHGQSAAARMSVSMGIRTRTMMDKSTRNLATMLAEGSGQGVLDCKRAEKDYPTASRGKYLLVVTASAFSGLLVNVFTDPFIGYFRNRFIFGQPAEIASVFTKIASGVTLINSLLSTVCAVVLYLALRPALEKAHLLPKD